VGPDQQRESDHGSQDPGGGVQVVPVQVQEHRLEQKLLCRGFCLRPQRTGKKRSAWALRRFKSEYQAQPLAGDTDLEMVQFFGCQIHLGADWKAKTCNPMHFQFCDGY
jgi:hypothetical protein